MKLKILTIFIVCLLSICVEGNHDAREDLIVKLTDANFDEEIKKYDVLLIEFYAPWDSESIKIAEELRRTADLLSKSNSNLKLAQVNCHVDKGLKDRFNITKYPVFKLYKNNELIEVTPNAQFGEEFVEFYRKSLSPSVREVSDKAEIESILELNEKIIVYYGETAIKIFNSVADDRRLIFVHCSGKCNSENVEKMILIKKGEEQVTLEAPFTEENISQFIESNIYPNFSFSSGYMVDYVFTKNKKVLFYLTKTKNDEFIQIIREVAKDYKYKLFFIIANEETEQLTNDLIDYYVIPRNELPEIRLTNVISDDEVYHYKFEHKEKNAENLRKFIDNFFEGKLETYVRSEEIPEHQGLIYKVVGKTFDEIVLKSKKNVFIKFYAPDESASTQIATEFTRVATAFKDVENLVIAEINILANELDIPIEGYPSFKLFLANDKSNPIEYRDTKHFEAMKDFLNEKLGINIQSDIKPEL